MSTDYCPLSPIYISDLLDGRLTNVRVHEFHELEPDPCLIFLTDGENYLAVYFNAKGEVISLTRYGSINDPQNMLRDIAETFDVNIVSEEDPRYWGAETEEEIPFMRELHRRAAVTQYPHNCKLPIDEWLAIRKKAALQVDPQTAEVIGIYAGEADPYGTWLDIPPEFDWVGWAQFARAPESDVWVWFGDLPSSTQDALWQKKVAHR